MPARHFDRALVRSVRRAAEISQSDVANALGTADSTVAGWELGSSVPDLEKLAALAQVLNRPLDVLFPRDGLPDLTDLRCDAGLYRYETAAIIGTKSDGPVAGAEQGVRRLKDRYLPYLAEAYHVTVDEVKRAQDRSMAKASGEQVDGKTTDATESERLPRTLAEKITFLLEKSFPGPDGAPGDAEIAASINAHAGGSVISAEEVRDLRTGVSETTTPLVLEGLAGLLGVTPLYFQPDDEVAAQVYEGLQLLAAHREGKVGRVRARGAGAQGLPPNLLALVSELVDEMQQKASERE
ncbi:helix-turn-helix transcriptional regulator [Streptomyces sp. NBC_00250]|uniref:helix-turn-helix transcriptional regulator n=1 Tax=Streptomyces sp. NBC_00250 TaxID=2903641 RepID=UPI002E2DEEB3|nr:helix-turn-helix transcriptional regulator [Streptomyces sp. NBC_00250]